MGKRRFCQREFFFPSPCVRVDLSLVFFSLPSPPLLTPSSLISIFVSQLWLQVPLLPHPPHGSHDPTSLGHLHPRDDTLHSSSRFDPCYTELHAVRVEFGCWGVDLRAGRAVWAVGEEWAGRERLEQGWWNVS